MIPKIIHQIWLQGLEHFQKNRPEEYEWSLQLKAFFPEYKYYLWTENDVIEIIQKHYPELSDFLVDIPNKAFLSDLGRYALLKKFGGLYFDTDYIIFKSFSNLFSNPETGFVALMYTTMNKFDIMTLGFSHNNCFFGAEKDSPILGEVLQTLKQLGTFKKSGMSPFDYTGKCLAKAYSAVVDNHLSDAGMLIISSDLLEPKHGFNGNKTCKNASDCQTAFPGSFAVHMGVSSWIPDANVRNNLSALYGGIRDYWQIFTIVLIALTLLLLVLFIITLVKWKKCTKKLPTSSTPQNVMPEKTMIW